MFLRRNASFLLLLLSAEMAQRWRARALRLARCGTQKLAPSQLLVLRHRRARGGIAEIVRAHALQAECLQGLQPLRQALSEKSPGSALAASLLPLASPSLPLVEMRC